MHNPEGKAEMNSASQLGETGRRRFMTHGVGKPRESSDIGGGGGEEEEYTEEKPLHVERVSRIVCVVWIHYLSIKNYGLQERVD